MNVLLAAVEEPGSRAILKVLESRGHTVTASTSLDIAFKTALFEIAIVRVRDPSEVRSIRERIGRFSVLVACVDPGAQLESFVDAGADDVFSNTADVGA